LEDHVKYLASIAFFLNMRLDQTEGAVVEDGRGLHGTLSRLLSSKPEVMLTLVRPKRVRTMHAVLSAISAKLSPQ